MPDYAGIRPKLTSEKEPAADFLIDTPAQHGVPRLVNLFGIESPGLTSSLSIAEDVVASSGLELFPYVELRSWRIEPAASLFRISFRPTISRFVFGNPGTTETTFLAAIAASKATYVLSLHESSAVGIAAGYALITGKPSIVSLHTYPGLANGMFNMRNALMAGVPLLVVNGQQDSRFLIHNPVLGAPNTRLAETATKYTYEVTGIDDLAVALQRCYLQARLQPTGPVFLSIPMNFMLEKTGHTTFKKTRIIDDAVPRSHRRRRPTP